MNEMTPAPVTEAQAMLAMIERLVLDPNSDVSKLERMLAMHREVAAQVARISFQSSYAVMQPKLPIIMEHGEIRHRYKETQDILRKSTYADWADINEAIQPIMGMYGFSISFRNGEIDANGRLPLTGILMHAEGHTMETTLPLPLDVSGSKNAVQSFGSTISYGKRYVAGMLLNFVSRAPDERDRDGADDHVDYPITPEQVAELEQLITDTKADREKVMDLARKADAQLAGLEDIKQRNFKQVHDALLQRKRMLGDRV